MMLFVAIFRHLFCNDEKTTQLRLAWQIIAIALTLLSLSSNLCDCAKKAKKGRQQSEPSNPDPVPPRSTTRKPTIIPSTTIVLTKIPTKDDTCGQQSKGPEAFYAAVYTASEARKRKMSPATRASIASGSDLCSGVIIDAKFILATHTCLNRLSIGSKNVAIRPGRSKQLVKGFVCPNYKIRVRNVTLTGDDLGLVYLEKALDFKNKTLGKICWKNMKPIRMGARCRILRQTFTPNSVGLPSDGMLLNRTLHLYNHHQDCNDFCVSKVGKANKLCFRKTHLIKRSVVRLPYSNQKGPLVCINHQENSWSARGIMVNTSCIYQTVFTIVEMSTNYIGESMKHCAKLYEPTTVS